MSTNSNFKKRGSSVVDILLIIVLLTVIAFGLIFTKLVFNEVNTELQADDDLGTEAKNMLNDVNTNYTNWSDPIFGFIFFGLVIFLLIGSYLIDTHPVFLVISIIIFIFVIFVGATTTNMFEETMTESELISLQSSYPITMYIMTHLMLLISITFAIMCIILYGKYQGGGL